jgi:hypothetical protein
LRLTGQNPECFNSGDVPVQQGGGWSAWQPRIRSRKEIEEERIAFGVLPKPVQRALKRAAAKVIDRIATEEDAEALIAQINAREEIAQVEAAAKLELSIARQRWKQVYDYIVQSLILQQLYERRQREFELAAELERQRIERMDQSDIAEIWSIWSQM